MLETAEFGWLERVTTLLPTRPTTVVPGSIPAPVTVAPTTTPVLKEPLARVTLELFGFIRPLVPMLSVEFSTRVLAPAFTKLVDCWMKSRLTPLRTLTAWSSVIWPLESTETMVAVPWNPSGERRRMPGVSPAVLMPVTTLVRSSKVSATSVPAAA